MENVESEKKKLIKEIERCLDDINFWRNNYVFESELDFEKVKEMSMAIDKAWLLYYRLYEKMELKK